MKRRDTIKFLGVSLVGSALFPRCSFPEKNDRVLRIAHITDVHIRPKFRCSKPVFEMY